MGVRVVLGRGAKFLAGVGVVGVMLAACLPAWAQQYVHRLVARMPYIAPVIGLSASGDYWYSGGQGSLYDGFDLYVNGVNYTEALFPGLRWAGKAYVRADRSVVWMASWYEGEAHYGHTFVNQSNYSAPLYGSDAYVAYEANDRGDIAAHVHRRVGDASHTDIWIGTRNVTEPVLGPYPRNPDEILPVRLLEDGSLFWGGRSPVTQNQWDWFRDDVNLTEDVLGPNRSAWRSTTSLAVNSSGQYAFEGMGSLTGLRWNVFVGQENYSSRVLGPGPHEAWLGGISENGSVAWWGHRLGEPASVYRDDVNLSQFLGPDRITRWDSFISRQGDVAWSGAVRDGGDYDVYVNQANISADLLGPGRSATPWGFTDAGLPIWFGWGSLVPNGALFVGRTNLGLEAFGSTSPWPSQWNAVGNARGDILW